jgi:DNA-binding winged helix-turn-helix (wHTH) protein/tetratricopeptide (TPR) repeat protein
MLKLSDLALRPDIQLGPMLVSPSRRLVEGPGGHIHIEPLIMQVFLLLLDASGKVVTRTELFDQCWGGVIVGDDSLNRAIAKTRRIGAQVAPGLYEIETIPRTGYRLTGEILDLLNGTSVAATGPSPISRRLLVGGGAATAAIAGVGGLWWLNRPRSDPRFDALMARGDEAIRDGSAFEAYDVASNNSPDMIRLYEQAVELQPSNARARGLLAYFRSATAEEASVQEAAHAVGRAQEAIRQALELDPEEPNARVALYLLQGPMLNWAGRDAVLRDILRTDPNNLAAMMELMPLTQAAGLTRESWMWNERILKASPFARANLTVRGLKLWILGRVRDSDNVIDRVVGLWPNYWFGHYARFNILMLTDRPEAARRILDNPPRGLPGFFTDPAWPVVLDALELRTPSAIESARLACLESSRRSPPLVNDMVMALCALGLKETAFELTEGFLLWRGKMLTEETKDARVVDNYNRRMTQWLFTPPCALMRADSRFGRLCDDFGLTAYWRARAVRPDYQVYG